VTIPITVISKWYNEESLAPLFLRHYAYVDKIHILLDTANNGKTRELLHSKSNVFIENVTCEEGYDERNLSEDYSRAISSVKEGWIYVVDSDEFIFPENWEDPQTFLKRQTADVVKVLFFHAYRHYTDSDIDYDKDPVPQRLHAQQGGPEFENWYIKPVVLRAPTNITLGLGRHTLSGDHSVSSERYIGSHWKMADETIAISRRLANKERMSRHNVRRGYANHEYHITEERIRRTLRTHSKFPILPYFVKNDND
jgi:hypothetical protein